MLINCAPSLWARSMTGWVYPPLLKKIRCFFVTFGKAAVAWTKSSYSSMGIGRFRYLHSQKIPSVSVLSSARMSISSCCFNRGLVPHHLPMTAGMKGRVWALARRQRYSVQISSKDRSHIVGNAVHDFLGSFFFA